LENVFTDGAGRDWPIKLDIFTVRRLKQETGVDLIDSADPLDRLLQRITGDVVLFADVLLSLLQETMRQRQVDEEQLLRAIDNEEVVERAALALVEAILSFSRGPKGALLKTAFGKTLTALRKRDSLRIEQAQQQLQSPQFDSLVEAAVAEAMSCTLAPSGSSHQPAVPDGSGSSNSPPPPASNHGATA